MSETKNGKTRKAGRLSVRTLTQTAVMTVLIAVCAWITVPSAVPFTLQTFGVFLSLKLLGGRKGTAAILLYILLGAVGAPVFSSFKGGAGVLFGPTGGYILGFLLTGLLYLLLERFTADWRLQDLVLFGGLLLCYLFGTLWFTHVMSAKGSAYTLMQALTLCVFPYIIPDILKLVLAEFLSRRLRRFADR